jgi:hypothetical protein
MREFNQLTGGKLIPFLRSRIPLIEGDTIESVALSAKHKAGAEYLLAALEDLLHDQEVTTDGSATNYTSM